MSIIPTQTPAATSQVGNALSSCWGGIKDAASALASWMSRTVQSGYESACELARKIVAWAQPYFEHLREFIQENPASIMLAAISATIGAGIYALVAKCFCSDPAPVNPNQQPQQQQQPQRP